MWGLSSAMLSSLHSSTHPLSANGDKSPEDDVWLPMWQGKRKSNNNLNTHTISHTHTPLTVWNTFVNVQ